MSCLSSFNTSAQEMSNVHSQNLPNLCCMGRFMFRAVSTLSTRPHGEIEILELFPVITQLRLRRINLPRHLPCFLSAGKIVYLFPARREEHFKRFINCADTVKFYVFQELAGSPALPQICQCLVKKKKVKLATVKTADLPTSIAEHNEMIRLTFANV